MRNALTALVCLAALAACKARDANQNAGDTARHDADTTVTKRTVQDTTIVTHDTIVHSDTIVKRGSAVPPDSARRRHSGRP